MEMIVEHLDLYIMLLMVAFFTALFAYFIAYAAGQFALSRGSSFGLAFLLAISVFLISDFVIERTVLLGTAGLLILVHMVVYPFSWYLGWVMKALFAFMLSVTLHEHTRSNLQPEPSSGKTVLFITIPLTIIATAILLLPFYHLYENYQSAQRADDLKDAIAAMAFSTEKIPITNPMEGDALFAHKPLTVRWSVADWVLERVPPGFEPKVFLYVQQEGDPEPVTITSIGDGHAAKNGTVVWPIPTQIEEGTLQSGTYMIKAELALQSTDPAKMANLSDEEEKAMKQYALITGETGWFTIVTAEEYTNDSQ